MKAAVITFPGSNCDDDLVYTLEKTCGYNVDTLWHKDSPDLSGYQLVALPGGFSYGDYLRCGAMASLSPILGSVRTFASGGGLVIGICNGFQILCEAGLLPGALARNEKLQFICQDVTLQVQSNATPWTRDIPEKDKLLIPIAHGDGRYVIDEPQYQTLLKNGQIVLTYENNPNGSAYGIAGVCNETKNVFGLMPHPERCSDLRSLDGMKLWNSVSRFLKEKSA